MTNRLPRQQPVRRLFRCAACFLVCAITAASGATASAQSDDVQAVSPPPPPTIWGLEFSPDGKWLAAAANVADHGGPIVVWRVKDWEPQVVRREAKGGLDVAFSPDGKLLAFTTRTPTVGLLEIPSGKLAQSITTRKAKNGTVMGVAFTPNGKHLLTSGPKGKIQEWNLADETLVREFEGHSDRVNGLAVSPDGTLMLSGGMDEESRLWDMTTGETIEVFQSERGIVRRVAFSQDGQFFLTSKWDGKTRIRESVSRQLRAMLPTGGHSAAINGDNSLVATTTYGSSLAVYRLQLAPPEQAESERIAALTHQLDADDYSVREAASRQIVAIGVAAGPALRAALDAASPETRIRARRLWRESLSPEPSAEPTGHRGDAEVVCFSSDGKLLATGCRGGDLKIWSVPDFKELITLSIPTRE